MVRITRFWAKNVELVNYSDASQILSLSAKVIIKRAEKKKIPMFIVNGEDEHGYSETRIYFIKGDLPKLGRK